MDKKTIKHKGKVIAHIFKKSIKAEGTRFLTPTDYSLQIGLLEHPKGTVLRKHRHNPEIEYEVDTTQEFLYVEKGKVKVNFFSDDWELVDEEILEEGNFMLHISGGHGFEILENCRLIEVKQGPYPGDDLAKIYKGKEGK